MRGFLSLREARANVAEIKDLCLGHVTLRTLRPLLKKIQGHWHTNGVISITRVFTLSTEYWSSKCFNKPLLSSETKAQSPGGSIK